MKKTTALLVTILTVITACPAYGMLSWLQVADVSLQRLDLDSYRLRVAVDWHAEDMSWEWMPFEEFPTPPPISTPARFNYFGLSLLGERQYNPTTNFVGWPGYYYNTPGAWQAEAYDNRGPWQGSSFSETVFGYDFDMADPITSPLLLDFRGTIDWSFRYDAIYHPYYHEYHGGTAAVMIIPEPPTALLFAFGLIIIGCTVLRRRLVSSRA